MMGKITPLEHKGLAMATFIGGGNIGVAIAPAVVIYLIFHYGISSLPWMILPALALTIAYYAFNTHRIPIAAPQLALDPNAPAWYKSVGILKLNAVMDFVPGHK